MDRENLKRAIRARRMASHYARETKQRSGDTRTVVVDLLSDLMHLADARRWSWASLVDKAEGHYLAEATGAEAPEIGATNRKA